MERGNARGCCDLGATIADAAFTLHLDHGMRWQYKRVNLDIADIAADDIEQRLDELGQRGWELVTSVQHARHGYSHEVHLLFKRGIQEVREVREPREAREAREQRDQREQRDLLQQEAP